MPLQGGINPGRSGWPQMSLNAFFFKDPATTEIYTAQAQAFANLTAQITAADIQPNPTLAATEYAQAEQTAVSLYMYVYMVQATGFWIVKPYITPYQGNWGYQTNPTIGAGAHSCFFWLGKG